MIRPIATEIVLFLVPFVLYAAYLFATRADVFHQQSWTARHIAGLIVASLLLVAASFLVLAQFGGSPPGSTYVPAHIEGGKLVPQTTR